ncbi:16S rRNA (cytidine(1402)-2'-O)-methyltransferase [Prauserella marina]|uniref:Ribosomal RNA small subunit methyltransferase I n=1 Tax=Prauserella marina TaxID=530584 RepID=A0A222VVX6_9PSEU|nr:16S rRNA (cytidine(1402)-2'-O)-methyltransferase [Prauserella marina]ASR38067.1 16S rRNA (cytidine(1402)-2'-O)-methyltransferase [Prauserella marina]PWV73312.1 16S rRNA (cytidine1402-2'-O)-methyltransferase [Prauserella marina]SDD66645.1 16S rRNA (cytidine1402-2'-O)-methyltransferase [Prauserella marina]
MTLVLAATPLGDSRDASPRLVRALGEADVIAAEDTRRLRSLATALGATPSGKVVSFYEDVETARLPRLVESVRAGELVLLVTDAGMPSVSDPGYRLVAACVAEDLPVTCLPGPSAVTTALALSGLPSDRFCFEGFAPRKAGEKARWLAGLIKEPRTVVFFESPHRVAATLGEAANTLGGSRKAAVCRELTKPYEEVRRGPLAELAAWAGEGVRGEITVVLAGAEPRDVDVADLVGEVLDRVEQGERLKTVAAEIASASGVSKKELYDAALLARGNPG